MSLESQYSEVRPNNNNLPRIPDTMDQPVCLASTWKSREIPTMGRESVSHETKVHIVPTLSAVPVPDTGATGTTPTDAYRGWKSVNAKVRELTF